MAIKIPTTLKLSQLKQVAFKCGIQSSGTKPILSQRLIDEISSHHHEDGSTRILSIDMGIRNLAYCVLEIPARSLKLNAIPTRSQLPSIIAWQRLTVSNAPSKTLPATKEAFDPATLSKAAYGLLRRRLIPFNPSKFLIERQRFRSMGSRHILEWTLRVNMLESMLYAILHTMKAEFLWEGNVVEVAPGKVGPFWIVESDPSIGEGDRYKKARTSKSSKIKNKGLKIDLVREWLEKGDVFRLGNEEVERTATAYVEKWDRVPGRIKGKKIVEVEGESPAEQMGKLDDLADCLLQGIAWREWEHNKAMAKEYGVESLIEDMDK